MRPILQLVMLDILPSVKVILESAQPLKVKDLCVAHNGTISNVEELSNLVGGCTFTPQNASDTLVAAQRLVSLITENGKLGSALSILKNEMVGSFCFTFLSDDDAVFAARDPKGFRPMVMGHKEEGNVHIVTSESLLPSLQLVQNLFVM